LPAVVLTDDVSVRALSGVSDVPAGSRSATACRSIEDLEQAVELGRALAADAPSTAVRCGRRRRPLRMTPKAVRRRVIKQHNRRLRARMLREQREES
jgi:hypothetical protein